MLTQQIEEKAVVVREINRDMQVLHNTFKQVAGLVEGQAEFVNKLEENAIETNESTKRAMSDLEDALKYQKKATCMIS
jgi:t-SNARE complex subunit (syntaxin)